MLRFANCKFDWTLENSRRLLSNPHASLPQQCQRYVGGAFGQKVSHVSHPSTFRNETSTLVPCVATKSFEWHVCRVKTCETNLSNYHQLIQYRDIYEGYLQKLKQLYEALDALSALRESRKLHQSTKNKTNRSSVVLYHNKVCDAGEILDTINKNLEFSHLKQRNNQYLMHENNHNDNNALWNALKVCNDRHPLYSLHSQHFSHQEFSLIFSKSDTPIDPQNDKELNENKVPSQDQLDSMHRYLVDNFPNFLSDKHDFSVYTKDIEFAVNWYPEKSYSTRGTVNYAIEIARLRVFVRIRLANVKMTLLKVTNHSEDGSIKVRWRVLGLSHSKMLWKYFSTRHKECEVEWLDGFSTFYLNKDGLIKKHCMDRVIPENEIVKGKPSMIEKLGLKIELPLPT